MYKNHTSMPQIMQQAHVHTLKSITFIKDKIAQQESYGDILQHAVSYDTQHIGEQRLTHYYHYGDYFPLQVYADSSDESDVSEDYADSEHIKYIQQDEKKDTYTLEAQKIHDVIDNEIVLVDEDPLQSDALLTHSVTLPGNTTQVSSDLNEHSVKTHNGRTTCELLKGGTHKEQEPVTVLALQIRDLKVESPEFTLEALNAIQTFVTEARQKLAHNENPISEHGPTILTYKGIHSHMFSTGNLTDTQIGIQIQSNGKLKYNYIYEEGDKDRNKTLLCRQGYILNTWNGYIQQIDYKRLYNSLDALFAVIYAQLHIQRSTLSQALVAKSDICNMFHSMHFPLQQYDVICHYARTDGVASAPNMPIIATVCDSEACNATITELAHMSIIMSMHKHFVTLKDTFAYELINALLEDIEHLWQLRETLMPENTHVCDIFEYGVVPVIHDVLPRDYGAFEDVFVVPEYMKTCTYRESSADQYALSLLTKGTNEMHTWGYAVSCLYAAIWESLAHSHTQHTLAVYLESVAAKIDKRLNHFVDNNKVNICKTMMTLHIQELSGGAMPLFCMAICSVMSLSQALDKITIRQDTKITLNKENLIRIQREQFEQFCLQE